MVVVTTVKQPQLRHVVSTRKVVVGLVLGALLLLVLFVTPTALQVAVFCLVGAFAVVELIRSVPNGDATMKAQALATVMFIVIFAGTIGAIRLVSQPLGAFRILAVALVVVATDAVAQVVGRRLGTRGTFFPALSPNKTLAGALGGLGAGIVVAAVVSLFVPFTWPVLLVVPLVAMVGDLLESATKRELGIKDFGSYLPDTGGVLDRIDSWLPALALVGLTAI